MNSFEWYNPTKIIFGEDSFEKISKEIPKNARILVTYGGGSIFKNGIYDAIKKQFLCRRIRWYRTKSYIPNA
jgi:NADP-dependent alcohol dehydrogenase